MKTVTIAGAGLLLASSLASANEIQLGEPSYSGSACPQGTFKISVDQAKKSLHFDSEPMKLEVGRSNQKLTDQVECNVVIPVTVPRNLSFAMAPVTYSGTVILPTLAQSTLKVVYYYDYSFGSSSNTFTEQFTGDLDRAFSTIAPPSPDNSPFWSACGVSANLRMNISMQTTTNSVQLPAEFTVDRIEGAQFLTQGCE